MARNGIGMMDRAATTADVGETWWREGGGKAKDPAFNDGAPCMVKKGLNGLLANGLTACP